MKIKSINELNEENINFIFSKMTNNYQKNMKILEKYLGDILFEKNNNNETLLHIFAKRHYLLSKTEIFLALLNLGLNPNELNNNNENFLEVLLQNYKFSFIYSIILYILSTRPNFNFNHQNNNGETIVHSLIDIVLKWCNINDSIEVKHSELQYIFYAINRILSNGFDVSLKDNKGRDIYNMMKELPFSKQKDYYLKLIEEKLNNIEDKEKEINKVKEEIKINDKDLKFIKRYGTLLNNENVPYSVELPTEIEDKIINNLSSNKMTLLKYDIPYITNDIIYSLPKMIKKYNKDKLNNRFILKTSFKEIINNCSTIGSFKGDFILLMRTCAENKVILVIDNIDEIILENMPDNDKEELNAFIEFYINTKDLILIGRANNEYFDKFNKFFNYNIIDIITKEKPKILKKTK